MTKLDGKEIIGMITNNRDDPNRQGALQVFFPHMGSKSQVKNWLQKAMNSSNTFDQPAQEGSLVSVFFPHGSGSVNGIVKNVLNGVRMPDSLGGLDLTTLLDGFKDALEFKPSINGPPDITSVSESNTTGAEKITTEITDKPLSSMAERVGLPANLVTTALVPLYDAVSSVSTALDDAASQMTPQIASMIPGSLMNMSSVLQNLPIDQFDTQIQSAISNLSKILGSSSPLSGTNFAQVGSRINEATATLSSAFEGVKTFAELENAISKVKSDTSLRGLADLANVDFKIDGPFGPISASLSASGGLEISLDDTINKLIEAFQSLVSGIQSATGSLLGNSDILNTFSRLPLAAQSDIKSAIEKIPSELSVALGKSNAFFGGS